MTTLPHVLCCNFLPTAEQTLNFSYEVDKNGSEVDFSMTKMANFVV